MSVPFGNAPGEGIADFLSLNGVDVLTTGTAVVLKNPLANWSVATLLGASTAATILLEGSAASSSDAPFSTILSITASTGGETNASTAAFTAKQVRLNLTVLSSSGSVHGWIAGTL